MKAVGKTENHALALKNRKAYIIQIILNKYTDLKEATRG